MDLAELVCIRGHEIASVECTVPTQFNLSIFFALLQEWKVVAISKMSEKSLFGIFILGQCDLAGVSIMMRYAPQHNPEAPSLGATSSASASSISDPTSLGGALAPLSSHSTAPTTPVGSSSPLGTSMVEGLNFQVLDSRLTVSSFSCIRPTLSTA